MILHIGLKDDWIEGKKRKSQTNVNVAGNIALQDNKKKEEIKKNDFSNPQVNLSENYFFFICKFTFIFIYRNSLEGTY